MVDVSCETGNVYREATYTLSHVTLPDVWLDKKSASTSVDLNPDAFLTPVGTRKTTGVQMKKCLCRKDFRTTDTLDAHLLIHRPEKLHTCEICRRVLKQHQFMSHMSTHHNRKTYHCTYSGCHKTYKDQNSLKYHRALRHGVRFTPPSSDSPSSRRETVDTPGVSKQQSYNTDLRGFFNSPRKLNSPNVAKSFSNPKETHPSQVKPPKSQPSWMLAAASKSYDFKEREMLTSTHWTPSVPHTVKEYPVIISLNDSDFESSPDSLELFPRKMSSLEPSKVTATATLGSSNASEAEYSHQHGSIQVKKTLNKLKRKRPSFTPNHSALSCPETKSGLIADFPDPVIATLPSTPVIRTPSPVPEGRKRKYKDSEKVLTDPAPVPQSSPKRSQTRSPCLVSPSQESPMEATGQDQNTCKRRTAVRRTQTQSPCTRGCCGSCEKTEELTPKPSFSTLREKGPKQKYKRKNSPAPIIHVSCPVTRAKAISSMSSPHSGEPLQTRKGLSKRSGRLTQSTISSPPTSTKRTHDQEAQGPHGGCATRGRTSQLRSPIYLEDHRASPRFPPPPYTPPPMLSPHRPRTGLYFNALLQYQQYPPAAPSNLGDDDIPVISIKPRINIGSRFQAEIPPLRNTFYLMYEEHPAQLVWSPRKDLTTNRKTQKQVSELLDMCCSSVLTGGGTNIELALHCLHEVEGNIPAALDLLLMREDFRITGHPLNNYHYTGSDHWTDQEMRLFRKSLEDHGKDFNKIHNVLQTKSVAQCVEYYYIWKNLKKFKQRVQAADEKDVEETSMFQDSPKTPPEQTRKSNTRRTGVQKRYPCEEPPLHLDQDRDWVPPGHKNTMSKDLYGP